MISRERNIISRKRNNFVTCFPPLHVPLGALSLYSHVLMPSIDEFQINEINVDLRTSGFDNEVLSVDACAV